MTRTCRLAVAGVLGGLLGASSGCAPLEDDRQSFLVDQLILDNQRWMTRNPELLRAKYRRMAADPYDFMRATATVNAVDWTRAGSDRLPTQFMTIRGTEETLLAGDPHPENIGVHRPTTGPVLVMEVNDLDGAGYGPYLWDVRRAMQGLGVLLTEAGCVDACLEDGLTQYAEGYVAGIQRGGPQSAYGPDTAAPQITRDLLDNATEDGLARSVFSEETELGADGVRRFVIDRALVEDRGDLLPTPDEAQQLGRLEGFVRDRYGVRVLDSVRRYGRGVASMPAIRYALLVDQGQDGDADDRLVQLREVVDPLPLPGWRPLLDGGFENNAERVVRASRLLWSRPDADPDLGARSDGTMTFKITSLSGWFEGFEHDRILGRVVDGRFDRDALMEWSAWLGLHLASVHDRAPTRAGDEAGVAIRADLVGREEAFVAERVADAVASVEGSYRDHRLFLGALDRLGPDLGAPR